MAIFRDATEEEYRKYYNLVSRLRRDKYVSLESVRRIGDLIDFANVRRTYSIIFFGSMYHRDKYPKGKVSRRSWWPWLEFVVFEGKTGRWWTVASGETSRKRTVHNALVDWAYFGSSKTVPIRMPGTTVVFNVDLNSAKIATDGEVYLVGHDIGMNYDINLVKYLERLPYSHFIFRSTALTDTTPRIYLAHIADRYEIERLW